MALLDLIKKQISTPAASLAPDQTTSGKGLRELLGAKTGKAASSSSTPEASSLQQKTAENQVQLGQQQLAQQGRLQSESISQQQSEIAQQSDQADKQFEEQKRDIFATTQRQTNQILNDYRSGVKQLNTDQALSDMEQVGFNIRLQNDQYINQLQDLGNRKRLDNQLSFKQELAKSVLAGQKDLLDNEIAFNQILEADNRTFIQELAQIDINSAMGIADNAIKASNTRAVAEGVGDLVTAGLSEKGSEFIGNTASSVKGIFKTTDKLTDKTPTR